MNIKEMTVAVLLTAYRLHQLGAGRGVRPKELKN